MGTTVFTDATNFTGAVGKFYDKKMIEQLVPRTVLYEAAEKRPVPLNAGNVVQFYKIKEFTKTIASITEGTTPAAEELSARSVTATLKQFFTFSQVSDIVDLTAVNPVVTSAIDPISNRAALTVDKEILWRLTGASAAYSIEGVDTQASSATVVHLSDVLDGQQGGLSTLYVSSSGVAPFSTFAKMFSYLSAQGATNAATDLANLQITTKAVRYAVAKLWRNNAQPAQGAMFDGIASPEILAKLMSDEDFVRWGQFTRPEQGKGGPDTVGEFAGVKWVASQSMAPIVSNTRVLSGLSFSASGVTFSGFLSLIYGSGAFAATELTGKGGVKVIVKTPGPSDTSNPGDLFSTVGAKITMAAVVMEPKKAYFLFNTYLA